MRQGSGSRSEVPYLHFGRFGRLAKQFKADIFQDLRNHGQSFHASEHNYTAMAEDVQEFMQQQKLDKCVLIGHSM